MSLHADSKSSRDLIWPQTLSLLWLTFNILLLLVGHANSTHPVEGTVLDQLQAKGLPDFSFCGYRGSEVPLPRLHNATIIALDAQQGDQSSRIQAALDDASRSADTKVVVLGKGEFRLGSGLVMPNGTVLKGAGPQVTILKPIEASFDVISIGGHVEQSELGDAIEIIDSYVNVGAVELTVANATSLSEGQPVLIQRQVTHEWIAANGMDSLQRNGTRQTWLKVGDRVQQPRTVAQVDGAKIILDIPLTDSLDSRYMQAQVVPYRAPASSSEMGVEDLSILRAPSCSGEILTSQACATRAVAIQPWAMDSWMRNLNITGFNSFVNVGSRAMRITIKDVTMHRNQKTNNRAGYPADLTIEGTQILVTGCGTYGKKDAKSFPVVTETLTPGPNAVVNHFAQSDSQIIAPHQRWAHGFLVDNSSVPVNLYNRAIGGTGQGWSINAGVAWNCRGAVNIQSPPLGANYCVGCTGPKSSDSNGTFLDYENAVAPVSLFAAQLRKRGF